MCTPGHCTGCQHPPAAAGALWAMKGSGVQLGCPVMSRARFFFFKRVQITPEYHTPVLVAPNPVSSHDGGPQPSHTSPSRAGAPHLSLWPGELVTVPGLCTAGSVLYSPDNCNPNSHSSVLVICREIIYAL